MYKRQHLEHYFVKNIDLFGIDQWPSSYAGREHNRCQDDKPLNTKLSTGPMDIELRKLRRIAANPTFQGAGIRGEPHDHVHRIKKAGAGMKLAGAHRSHARLIIRVCKFGG